MIKDISRFKNRDIKRTILLDPKPVNYIMTPENSMPVFEYTAEFATGKNNLTDDHLLQLIEEIDDIKDLEDIRPAMVERFKVRELLKNSKLI